MRVPSLYARKASKASNEGSLTIRPTGIISANGWFTQYTFQRHHRRLMRVLSLYAPKAASSALGFPNYVFQTRLGGKFHPRYLPMEFTGISRHGKLGSSGKYWQIMANITFLSRNTGKCDFSCEMQQISLGSWLKIV